jgi:hypothetical protein
MNNCTTIITAWWNEEFLAPFFLKHYTWCDRIFLLLDKDTTDKTLEIALKSPNVVVVKVEYPDGMDDRLKIRYINEAYRNVQTEYCIVVDADEFIDVDEKRIDLGDKIIRRVKFFNVYRHAHDKDLDINRPLLEQRRHGVYIWPYTKACIVRRGLNLKWGPGCHSIKLNAIRHPSFSNNDITKKYYGDMIHGAHWANADACFCVNRRIANGKRQGNRNLTSGMTRHNHGITEVKIMDELLKHRYDWEVL